MAGNNFIPNKLGFDVAGFTGLLSNIYNLYLDELSDALRVIVAKEIMANGNGSTFMRLSAAAEVEETKREITKDTICLEVGIDSDRLKAQENVFVRVYVVLHGNQTNGPLKTKPGQETWSKHIIYKGLSTAEEVYDLPDGFNQDDVFDDISTHVESNVSKQINSYVNQFIRNISQAVSSLELSAFVKGG